MSLKVGWDIRFARDSGILGGGHAGVAARPDCAVFDAGPEAMHTYEQVQLEGQVTPDMDAQSDVDLITAVDENIEDIKAISSRLEIAIKVDEI